MVAITNGFMPVLMDVVYDINGNYELGMIAAALGMLLGASLIFNLPEFRIIEPITQPKIDR